MRTHAKGRPEGNPVRELSGTSSGWNVVRPRPVSARAGEPCCGKCGYRTRLVPNPYYGAGLAVHRYFRVCRRCPWTAIVREDPKPQPITVAVPVVEAAIERPVRRLALPWSHREAS